MISHPQRFVSLWEMLKLNAEAFYKAVAALNYAQSAASDLQPNENMDNEVIEITLGHVKELQSSLLVLGTKVTSMSVDKLLKKLVNKNITFKQFYDSVQEIDSRLRDELSLINVYVLDNKTVPYFDPPAPLFGVDVEAKFPQMSEDIAESGKCLALNRQTAAVFHLMRVMELAVQYIGKGLGITFVDEKNWQNILDEINKAIKSLDHKLPKTKAFAETACHLYTVKVAWRNEVMHPKQTYTPDEAEAIFANVRTFIKDLAISV